MGLPITLTEGPDVYYSSVRGGDPDLIMFDLYMLGGDDKLFTSSVTGLRVYMGAGNDYARMNMMYQYVIHGEAGDDVVDIASSAAWTVQIYGGEGADRVNFLIDEPDASIWGGLGNDAFYGTGRTLGGTIRGDEGDDRFVGFGGSAGVKTTLAGGKGNDVYHVDPSAPPTILESSEGGIDTVVLLYSAPYVRPANIENVIVGTASLPPPPAPPPPPPPPSSTTIMGDNFNNTLSGSSLAESIFGLGGNDTLRGYGGMDLLAGGDGNDSLYGGTGADSLKGGAGNDMLRGDAGRDEMWGELGADTFVFDDGHFGGVTTTSCDVIHDFSRVQGDKINLSPVDAKAGLLGDQAFLFIGTSSFGHVAGQLRYQQINGSTYIQGDTNGDAIADFRIRLDGLHTLSSVDFWL